MCLTGSFALAMMLEPAVIAPVLSQPSLPFPIGNRRAAGLDLSPEELAAVRDRVRNEPCPVMGLRFSDDFMSRGARFKTLKAELGSGFEDVTINSKPGNPHDIPRSAHSVVTEDLVDEPGHPTRAALDRVLEFFDERLKPM